MPAMTPEEFAEAANVSRETMARLEAMDRVFLDWSSRHNLVAKSTIEDRWERHYLDSAQLVPLLPEPPAYKPSAITMAAGLATLREISRPGFYEAVTRNTTRLLEGLCSEAREAGIPEAWLEAARS